MMSNWIIAPVVLPALVAPLILLAARNDLTLQRVLSLTATLALLAVAVALVWAASVQPAEPYWLGDWPAPFGIALMLDRLSAAMVALTAVLAVPVLLYAIGTGWDARGRHFHALFQFQLMGLNGAFLTADAFNLFVFFEVLLIASYGLMIHGGGAARLKAGVQYVGFNLIASTLFLFALGLTYAVTGTLNMADLAGKVAALPAGEAALIRVAGVLLLIVFCVKAALVPLQFWLPGTYAAAPGVTAALFAVMTKVGAYAVLRMFTLVFPPGTPATGTLYADLLAPAAAVTVALGALGVLGSGGLARIAAFGGIASMGTLFLAVSAFTPQSTAAAMVYLLHSTLATAAMFLVADLVTSRRGSDTTRAALPPFPQIGLAAAAFFAAAIAMAGMPPLSGFLGKLLVLDALRGDGQAWVWGAILVGSFLMVLGFARAGSAVFWKCHAGGAAVEEDHPSEPLAWVALGILFALIVALTVFAGPVTGWMERLAADLYAPGPAIDAMLSRQGEVP